jgi:carbonic anhydrase
MLASIQLDAFKAHFILEDEAKNVLAPMEHAFTHKQKVSEMDS